LSSAKPRGWCPPRQVDASGTLILRNDGRLHHIGLDRARKGRAVKLLVADLDIRILAVDTGEPIRRLTLDPNRDYQPIEGGETSTMSQDICLRCLGTQRYGGGRIRTRDLRVMSPT
jgi:hypothetical protein